LTKNEDFINQILKIINKSLTIKTKMDYYIPCDTYSEKDYNKLLKLTIPLEEFKQFKKHCQNCTACQKGITQAYERYILKKDQKENTKLYQKTIDLLDKIDEQESNLIDVLINVSKDILEITKTTGEVLPPPILAPSRGGANKQKEDHQIHILQEFDAPFISVQAAFKKNEPEEPIEMCVSLLDRKTEEFMVNIEIILTGPGKKQKKSTDKNGKAIFFLQGPGNYKAVIVSGEDQIAKLKVKVN